MANQIRYNVDFNVQKKSLQALKSSLKQIQKINFNDIAKFNNSSIEEAKHSLINIKTEAANVESALKQAFNVKLNTVNVDSFNQALAKSGSSLSQVYQEFSKAGPVGQATFRDLANSVLDVNLQLRQTHPLLDKMATTLANTVKWQAASSAVNAITRSVQQAWGFTKSLDGTLNDIRIVTGKTADEMDRFAIKANAAAQQLGKTTTDYTKASLIYAQQGLSDEQVQARTAITLKTANVTGQSTAEVSEQLTAVWNGYKVNADQAELYVDRLAAVAATTASDLEELSTGMSKVASAAAAMGVGEDQLAAQLATIISVTKQAPESVGTALRTIYARISDIKAGISQDDVTLGNYSGKMAELGFNVLDVNGNLRDMGQVIEEIGGKWGSLTREQQISLTQTMAGQRQYNNLLALFDNFEQYNETLATAQQAAGTLEQQQSIYMEGMAAHLNSLKAAVEGIYQALFNDTDSINGLLDGLKDLANFTSQFVESIGGGVGVLRTLGAVGMTVFNDQIARGITTMITNFQAAKTNAMQLEASINTISKLQQENPNLDIDTQRNLQSRRALLENINILSPEEYQQGRQKIVETDQALAAVAALQKEKQEVDQLIKKWADYIGIKESVNQIYESDTSKEKISQTINAVDQLEAEYDDLKNRIEELKTTDTNAEDFKNKWSDTKSAIEDTIATLTKFQGTDIVNDQELKQLNDLKEKLQKIDEVQKAGFSNSGLSATLLNRYKQLVTLLDSVQQKLDKAPTTSQEGSKIVGNLNNNPDSNRYKFEQAQEQARRKAEAEANNNEQIALAARVKQYTNLASGIARVGTAIKQVQRLGSIWNDKDLSNGEKILQTMINIGTTAPMVTSAIQSISTALSMSTMATGIFGAAVAGLMVAVTVFSSIKQAAQAARQAQIDLANENIDKANTKQEQIDKNLELYDAIEQVNKQYENGQISRSQLKSSVQDLIEQYGLEDDQIQTLTSHYGDLTESIYEARKARYQEKKEAGQTLVDNANTLLKQLDFEESGAIAIGENDLQMTPLRNILLEEAEKEGSRLIQEYLPGDYAGGEGQYTFRLEPPDLNDENDIVEYLKYVQSLIQNIKTSFHNIDFDTGSNYLESETYKYFAGQKDRYSEFYNTLEEREKGYQLIREAQANLAALEAEASGKLSFDESQITNLQSYKNLVENLRIEISKITDEQGNQIFPNLEDQYDQALRIIQQRSPELISQFEELRKIYGQTINTISKQAAGQDSAADLGFKDSVDMLLTLQQYLENFSDQQLDFFEQMDLSKVTSWQQLFLILFQIANLDFSNIDSFSEDLSKAKDAATDNYTFFQSLEDQVRSGKSISKSEFKNMSEQTPEIDWSKYFTQQANGTYKMTADAEEFYNTVNSLKLDGFYSAINQVENRLAQINKEKSMNYDDISRSNTKTFTPSVQGDNGEWEVGNVVTTPDLQQAGKQLEYLQAITSTSDELYESIVRWKSALNSNLDNSAMLDTLNQIQKAVEENDNKLKDNSDQQKQLIEEKTQLYHTLHDAMFPTDSDIDQSDLAQLTNVIEEMAPASEDLADSLQEDQRAAEDVAEAILRFDDAIQDVVKNYDDWMEALNSGTAQQQAEVIDDLRDAYSDLLDLDGSSLSEDFLTNTDNLELMKAAIDGDTQAYDELLSRAGQDIIAHLDLDKTQFESDLNTVQNQLDAMNFQDLEIGANLDTGNFLQACSDLVTNAGMTAQQATDYLASMGVNAQVIENDTEATESKEQTGFNTTWTPVPATGTVPLISGTGLDVAVQNVPTTYLGYSATVTPTTETVTDTKENKAFSLKVTSAKKKSGGDFKFSQAKNGGGSGGQKRRSSGGGGKGKSCFVAGTLVSTSQGFENIENIKIGDIVLSHNLKTHQNEYSEVLQTMIHDTTEEIYSIHVQNDIIQSTGIHKFLIVRNQKVDWIPAQELKVTDLVHFSDGSLHKIDEIHVQIKTLTVYNFEVSNNHNYYVGQNGILVHNKGGKGGGGGKGSQPDKSQKDLKKALEDERDIYHDINIQLDQINRNLDRTQKKQDRLYGKQLLDNLNKQTKILQQHNLKLKEKQDLQQQDLRSQQDTLKNLGVTFDQYGNIANYMDILGQKQGQINKAIEEENQLIKAYNESTDKDIKKGIADEITKADKKVKQAEDAYKNLEDKIKKYDDLREDMEDLVDDIEENLQQQIEIEITKFRMEVQIRLDMGEAERDWNKFVRQVLQHDNVMTDSDFDKIFKDTNQNIQDATSYFNVAGSPGAIEKLTDQLYSTLNESQIMKNGGWSTIYGDNQAQAMQDMQNDLNQLMNQMEDFESLIQDIDKAYLDTIDDIQDQFDKQIEDYEYVNELLEHDMDLLELVYGDRNYEAMDKYYTKLQQNNNRQLDSLNKQRDFWKDQWQQAVARGDTKAAEQFKENYKNTISELNDLIKESAENLQQQYENSINSIFYNLDKKVSGGHGTDYLDMQWELMNKHADEYLDTINSAFAIQQTQRKYQKALDETKSIKNQQALKKLMNQQLDILKNKEKLTEYDVERAEKLLQVEQARIALEEAQSSKTSMRLKRDSQGNYSYEYVADKNAIDDAQANLATAQNDLYNFDKDRYQTVLNDMLSLWKDFQEKYKEIVLDTSLTEEERVERLATLRQYYGQLINDKLTQNLTVRNNLMESAFADLAALYNTDVANFNQMSNEEQNILMNELVPMWGSGVQQMTDIFAGEGGFIATCEDAFGQLQEATQQYQQRLREMAETAGFSFDDIVDGIDDTVDQMQSLIMSNQQLISLMGSQILTVTQLRMQAQALTEQYKLVYEAAKAAATAIHDYIQAEKNLVSYNTTGTSSSSSSNKSSTSNGTSSTKKTTSSTSPSTSGSTGTGSGSGESNGGDGSTNSGTKSNTTTKTNTTKKTATKTNSHQSPINNINNTKKKKVTFATGGYTGDWNSDEGRIAVLHQKELVLNEKDTENFLDSMYILRSITDSLNGNIYERLSGVRNSNIFSSGGDELEQNVHIEATFPNVDSKRQIEEAFSELVNMAAQRAMRR